jgi:hypothetical protein
MKPIPRIYLMQDKRGKGSAGEGDKCKKAKTASDASGGKSASDKSQAQPTSGKVSEKSHVTAVTRTSKNPFEVSIGQKAQYYVGVVKDKRTGKMNGLEFLIG